MPRPKKVTDHAFVPAVSAHPADKVIRMEKLLPCHLSSDELRERGRDHAKAADAIADEEARQKKVREEAAGPDDEGVPL